MAKKTAAYDNQSITSLKGADRVRKRPAVIFGSDGLEGCEHSVFEILSNSVDEARQGYGSTIEVTVFADRSVEIADSGRGVPLGWNEKEKRYNWELIYCELYAGGKYENNSEGASYEFSLGLNGLGACATQYSSEFMEVVSFDGTNRSEVSFKKGNPVGADGKVIPLEPTTPKSVLDTVLRVTPLPKRERRTGTIQRWRPDLEVFTAIDVSLEYYTDMLKKQAVVNAGKTFKLFWQTEPDSDKFEEYTFYYQNGIADYVAELAGGTALTQPVFWKTETSGRDRSDKEDYKLKVECSFCCSNTVQVIEYYHCSSYLEHGGSPDKAVRSAFVAEIDRWLKSAGKYNKNESKITFSDVEDCLILITNSVSTQTSYANQTKKAITNSFIAEAMTAFLRHNLEVYFAENPTEAEKLCGQVLINKRSREHAETSRLDLKKKLSGTTDISNRVERFVGCRSKDPEVRELYIVEGNSAMTSCKLARDAEFQAIIPVRGKTLNCLKAGYDKIFKNDIIVDLLKVIGCGVELKGKVKGDLVDFDERALRWSKIIICTDADKDGYQIRTLLLTIFYRLLPTLLKRGKIYIAESPLYELTCRDKINFAYNEKEKLQLIKSFGNAKYTIQRSKGLGENEPDMMRQTTMNPASRRLIAVAPADDKKTFEIFDTMLGDNLPARKAYIAEHGGEYINDIDLDED
jgi:Type IIA topoisomerase (DNA gyrase/topo II, topoisomerase IV), B subunit